MRFRCERREVVPISNLVVFSLCAYLLWEHRIVRLELSVFPLE